jgi:hypothetical protein
LLGVLTGHGQIIKHILLFSIAVVIVVFRRPDDILHAQFFAEDGPVWYGNAYSDGWLRALFFPYAGYIEILPRLAASIALLVPLYSAPLVMNCVGIFFQVLPINVLISPRSARLGSFAFRASLAASYLLLPNRRAVHVTVTNAQWHLALLACLLVVAIPPKTGFGKIFDASILVLCGLTGPFCFMLLPIALFVASNRGGKWQKMAAALMVITSGLQAVTLLLAGRPRVPLGASIELLTTIVAGHIYSGALLGSNRLALIGPGSLLITVAVLGTAVVLYCLAHSESEFRMVILFCVLVFAASLGSPMGTALPAWPALKDSSVMRYWVLPTIAFAWCLQWCVKFARSQVIALLSGAALVVMCFGVILRYSFPALNDLNFRQHAAAFESAPPGAVLVFPVNPAGWTVTLKKR